MGKSIVSAFGETDTRKDKLMKENCWASSDADEQTDQWTDTFVMCHSAMICVLYMY